MPGGEAPKPDVETVFAHDKRKTDLDYPLMKGAKALREQGEILASNELYERAMEKSGKHNWELKKASEKATFIKLSAGEFFSDETSLNSLVGPDPHFIVVCYVEDSGEKHKYEKPLSDLIRENWELGKVEELIDKARKLAIEVLGEIQINEPDLPLTQSQVNEIKGIVSRKIEQVIGEHVNAFYTWPTEGGLFTKRQPSKKEIVIEDINKSDFNSLFDKVERILDESKVEKVA